jgi:short-subunit dehydrogenase
MLTDKVALITGCSSGIGRALVPELAERGCRVYATARRPETLSALVSDRVKALALDVTQPESMAAAVKQIQDEAGTIDILVNNAGFGQMGPMLDLTPDQLRFQFETNVVGQMELIKLCAPGMIKQRSGCIVNIGSVSGEMTTPFAGAYCASKAAIHSVSEALRMELAPFGVEVVIVKPGAVKSAFGDNATDHLDLIPDSMYKPVEDGIKKRAKISQEGAEPADTVARDIADAIEQHPRPFIVHTGAGSRKYIMMKRTIPAKKLDHMMIKRMGLDKLGSA